VISATVDEVAGGGTLGAAGLGGGAIDEAGGGDGGVPTAHPAMSRTNARGMVNGRVRAFMALVRSPVRDG
jgi:hypothetical protein